MTKIEGKWGRLSAWKFWLKLTLRRVPPTDVILICKLPGRNNLFLCWMLDGTKMRCSAQLFSQKELELAEQYLMHAGYAVLEDEGFYQPGMKILKGLKR
jgi:hypothetical protein